VINWMFQNPARLKRVGLAFTLTCLVLTVLLTIARINGISQHRPPTTNNTWTTAEPTSTGLLPPSPAVEPAPATPSYGPSTPIALEAVQAFLQGDHARFAELGQQNVVEAVNDSPTPGGEITGPGKIHLGGPTQQVVLVPTTDGELTLTMIVVDGAWKVAGLEYSK
jgi:hypothetical protein